jgi:hypothetical protein
VRALDQGWISVWNSLGKPQRRACPCGKAIEPVAQEIGERASGEGDTADGPPIRELADFGDDAALPKVGQKEPDAAEVEVGAVAFGIQRLGKAD